MKKWRTLLFLSVLVLSLGLAAQAFAVTTELDMPDGAYLASTTKIDISAIPESTSVGSITDGVLAVGFDAPLTKYTVGVSWATWSSPPFSEDPKPHILFDSDTSAVLTLDKKVSTFGFEMEPNPMSPQSFTVTFKLSAGDVVVDQIVKVIDGSGGARLVALRALDQNQCFDKVEIVASSDYAMGQFRYALCPEGAWSISDDLTPQGVRMDLPVAIKVHPTIWMDTDVDELVYPCANPLTNSQVRMGFDWTIKSNVPWWKRIQATGLAMNGEFESFAIGTGGYPDGYETVQLADSIAADRVKFSVDGVQVANPWWSDILGDVDNHEDTERIEYQVDINWCDTAGYYNGFVMLSAFQN